MDYETLLVAFVLIIFVTALFRFMDQKPSQVYVHTCNEYNSVAPSRLSDLGDDSSSCSSSALPDAIAHIIIEDSDSEDEEEEEENSKEKNEEIKAPEKNDEEKEEEEEEEETKTKDDVSIL